LRILPNFTENNAVKNTFQNFGVAGKESYNTLK